MVSAALGGVIMVAVLTSFLFLVRTGASLQNYAGMEAQARNVIGTFGDDVRTSKKASWTDANTLVLSVLNSDGGTTSVTYTYIPSQATLTRSVGGATTTLLTGIASFTFKAYNQSATDLNLETAAATALTGIGNSTKQVQLSLRMIRSTKTVADATNAVISARFIMRNKRDTT